MNADELKAFEETIYSYVGRQVCPPTPARDPVNEPMIRHWTEAMGDTNPAYTDADWAAGSARGGVIAPPAMMFAWGQTGFAVTTGGRPPDAQVDLIEFFNEHGYTGVLGTNVRQEYFKESRPGDTLSVEMVIDNISERKTTARGTGYFIESLATFTDQHGDKVGTQRFKILKFMPQEESAAAPADEQLEVPTRIASPRGHDNGWWWEACRHRQAVDPGAARIARRCGTRRGPCAACASPWHGIPSNRPCRGRCSAIPNCTTRKSPATRTRWSAP
ncbi:MAG: MaoC family dehydratase N-terminal domain-containing protein [Halioglobus sp.]|nr:MaoC family dehydratase N-terminal domain-containing protein [Halioglobus sp.]